MWLEDCVLHRPLTDLEKKWLGVKFRFHAEKPLRFVTPKGAGITKYFD